MSSDWRIPQRTQMERKISRNHFTRKKTIYSAEDEDDDGEPITLDKVIGFINGETDNVLNTAPKSSSATLSMDSNDKAKSKEDISMDEDDNDAEHFPIGNKNVQTDKKYELNVSVEVESGDKEFKDEKIDIDFNVESGANDFDDDSVLDSIQIPDVPPSDDDEDFTNFFGEKKPIITSVKSLRSDFPYIPNKSDFEGDSCDYEFEPNQKMIRSFKKRVKSKILTNDLMVINEYELLEPVRYEAVDRELPDRPKRVLKPKIFFTHEHISVPLKARRIRCRHCSKFFFKDDLQKHMAEVTSNKDISMPRRSKCTHCGKLFFKEDLQKHMLEVASNKDAVIDKLLKVPVVKIQDLANDLNLDPKLKARFKDQKHKREHAKHYTLRHCVHCDKAFITLSQMKKHIVDVIYGLDLLKKDGREYNCNISLNDNNTNKVNKGFGVKIKL